MDDQCSRQYDTEIILQTTLNSHTSKSPVYEKLNTGNVNFLPDILRRMVFFKKLKNSKQDFCMPNEKFAKISINYYLSITYRSL